MSRALTLILQLASLYFAGRLGGRLARRLGAAAVVGELAGGMLIGPTVLGRLWPDAAALLDPIAADPRLRALLFVYLVVAGLETRFERGAARGVAAVSALGLLVPFAFGAALGPFADGWVKGPPLMASAFLGTALAITALPVIARILAELGLTRTRVGQVVLGAAVIDDVVGWTLFGLVLALHGGRPALGVGLVGAFLGGALLARLLGSPRLPRLAPLASGLSSIYFVAVGMRADFIGDFSPALALLVFLLACAGKLAGAYAGARWAGLEGGEARAVAFGMNARGAMEMALASVALEAGIIARPLFVALVVMALATSAMAAPGLRRWATPP